MIKLLLFENVNNFTNLSLRNLKILKRLDPSLKNSDGLGGLVKLRGCGLI